METTSNTYVIAEAGVNHNGSLEMAIELIDVAAGCGADAVKFQTFQTAKIISRNAPKADYQIQSTGAGQSQFDMVKKLELDEQAHRVLIAHCKVRGIEFLSTPFDLESVEMLTNVFNLPRIKLPSGEITNAPLLLKAAQSGKKIIMSTGMSTLGDIETALGILAFGYTQCHSPSVTAFQEAYNSFEGQKAIRENVSLLHCTTEYPAPLIDVNLRAMDTLQSAYGLPVGFSDHTSGITISLAAVARGAMIIEKHFTLDRSLPGPDHKASLEPAELKQLVASIRDVELALGSFIKTVAPSELNNKNIVRKSLVAARDITKGELFTADNLTTKRPGRGLSPLRYWEFIGKASEQNYAEDEEIK